MVRLALVGCGRIMPAHLHGYKAIRDAGAAEFEIVALVARREEDGTRFRKRGEGPEPRPPVGRTAGDPLSSPHMYVSDVHPEPLPDVYTDWRKVLERDDVDALDIYAPVHLHHEMALAALAAGKHVYVEKPLAVSVAAGRKMVRAARDAGRTLGVAEVLRYFETTRAAKWAIGQGMLGAIQYVVSHGLGGPWSPADIVAGTPWRHRKLLAGGGASIDIGVHLFDLLRYLCGEVAEVAALAPVLEPERTRRDAEGRVVERASNDTDDAFFANIVFESGAVGQLSFSWSGHGRPTGLEGGTAIYGTRGSLHYNGWGDVTFVADGGAETDVLAAYRRESRRAKQFPAGIADPFGLEKLDFLRAAEAGRDPETSGQEGLKDLACAFAICESARRGGNPVRVAEVEWGQVRAYQAEIDAHYGL